MFIKVVLNESILKTQNKPFLFEESDEFSAINPTLILVLHEKNPSSFLPLWFDLRDHTRTPARHNAFRERILKN